MAMQYPELPKACPECRQEFSTVRTPQPQFTKRGIGLFIFAGVFTLVWIGALSLGYSASDIRIAPKHPAGAVVIIAGVCLLFFGPGIAIANYALRHRSITMKCRKCGWSGAFAMLRRKGAKIWE